MESKRKSGICEFLLPHGGLCGMLSSPFKKEGNFQSLCEHRVPPCKKAQGWRLSITFRADSDQVEESKKEKWNSFISIGEECYVGMRPAKNLTKELIEELLSMMKEFGTPDKTKVFGKEFENKGRKVLELSFKGGQTYTYGGKTTSPGQAFGKETLKFLQEEELFGEFVKIENIWAHMVFYPTPDCQLAWHRDNENGLNPHAIISLTLLEDPKLGVRPFSVRLLSDKERNKKKKK